VDEVLPGLASSLPYRDSQSRLRVNLRSTTSQREGARRALAALESVQLTSDPGVAKDVVSRFLDRCAGGQLSPKLIDRFLRTHLRSYLMHLCVVEGELSPNWRTACELSGKLVWSVQPKQDQESRKQLYALLPELFEWLHDMLRSQQVSVPEEDAFFAELARLHAAALNSPERHAVDSSSQRSSEPPVGTGAVEHPRQAQDRSADSTITCDRPGEQTPAEQPPKADDEGMFVLSDLLVGTCFEFTSGRAAKRRMQLKWMSSRGRVFLFQDYHSEDTLYLTASRLDQRLRDGTACALI